MIAIEHGGGQGYLEKQIGIQKISRLIIILNNEKNENNIEQWRNEKKRRTRVTRCIITLSEESVLAGCACHREFWKLLANWIPTRHTTYMHMLARAILFYLYVARMCSFHACIQHSLYSFAPLKSSLHDYRNVFI